MNPLIQKEIRLLLPAWIVAMALVVLTPSIPGTWLLGSGTPLGFILGLLLLGIASFGQELSSGSFSTLLSHPMERSRIWNVKTRMLAYAFILVFAGWVVRDIFIRDVFLPIPYWMGIEPLALGRYVLLALAIFSGSLWTTLLLRQIIAAFGLTLLVPLAMIFWDEIISDHYNWSATLANTVFDAVLAAYSIAGFLWARRLFLHAQDTQWTGGDFSFTWRAKISRQKSTLILKQPRHWLFALAWKEILLHQANLLIAALILAFQLSCNFILKIHPHFQDQDIKYILESGWVFWLLIPLLIGSAAVAEERKLGTFESQLCLPVSRRFQLAVKFSTGLCLSLFLGCVGFYGFDMEVFMIFGAIFFISFYASSLARTTLQAIGLAVLTLLVVYSYETQLFFLHAPWTFNPASPFAPVFLSQPGREILRHYFSLPILILAFGSLAVWNFKWLHQSRKLWWRNLIVLLTAFASISILANAIYFRAWEFVSPIERPPGPALLSIANPPKFTVGNGDVSTLSPDRKLITNRDGVIFALLPGGRLWSGQIRFQGFPGIFLSPLNSRFIDGTNWISAASYFDNVQSLFAGIGIQSDGTLWQFNPDSGQPARIGMDTNWQQVTRGAFGCGFALLKNNGTLWQWRENPGSRPQLVGNGTNCAKLFSYPEIEDAFVQKNDGSLWWVSSKKTKSDSMPWLYPMWERTGLTPVTPAVQKIQMPGGWIELSTNGDLSYSRDFLQANGRPYHSERFPLGQNAKWTALAARSIMPLDNWFTIRSDGTLWEWKLTPPYNFTSQGAWAAVQPVQLGNRSDWVALVPVASGEGVVATGSPLALTADGSLWVWNQPSQHNWMARSRRPTFMGNIFQATPASP